MLIAHSPLQDPNMIWRLGRFFLIDILFWIIFIEDTTILKGIQIFQIIDNTSTTLSSLSSRPPKKTKGYHKQNQPRSP